MGKRYSTRLIKEDYSYYVEQVADLLDVDVGTVRRWINEEGLQRIPNTRPHLIHSSALKRFLGQKMKQQKKPCLPNECFCLLCQSPRTPQPGSARLIALPNRCIRFQAVCSQCDRPIHRSIRASEWGENHPLAAYLAGASEQHKGVWLTHRIYALQEEV